MTEINKIEIINYLIRKHNYKSYLEIGLSNPKNNFVNVVCENKESCDPYEQTMDYETATPENDEKHENPLDDPIVKESLTYHMTSDKMFEEMPEDKKYDLIFIDGLHDGNQVMRDFCNSLRHLNNYGIILIHDCLPISEKSTGDRVLGEPWFGTTWKAIPTLHTLGYNVRVIDTDCGIGIYMKNEIYYNMPLPVNENLTFDYVFSSTSFRNRLMGVINVLQFAENY